MAKTNLIGALKYASQNPESEFAKKLGQTIASGQVDQQAQQLGINLAPIKQKFASDIKQGNDFESGLRQADQATGIATDIVGGQKLAEGLGMAIAAPKIQKELSEIELVNSNIALNLQKRINENKKVGKDTSRLEKALADLKLSQISLRDSQDDFVDALPTNKEVIGSAARLATTALGGAVAKGAGALTGLGKATTVTGGVLRGAGAGALSGGALGAATGAGVAAENDASTNDIISGALGGAATGVIGGAVIGGATGGYMGSKAKSQITPKAEEIIAQKIQPKPTAKQAKLAMEEGRLFKGKSPGLVTRGTPDKIAATAQQAKSAKTIKELIPGAENMDDPTLYTAIKEQVDDIATRLKPELRKIPVDQKTVKDITTQWNKIKKEQVKDAFIPSNVNLKRLQSDFQNRLMQSKSGSIDDLWETRQAYDNSVPDSVKNATSMSSESLQAMKELWIQNRKILSDAINNSSKLLGDKSTGAFAAMRDLYEAKNALLTKAMINTTGDKSQLSQFVSENPAARAASEAIGVGTGIRILGN